jgi:hypothetical protein
MITNKDIYRCYSVNLKEFMALHNIRYFLVALDSKTHRTFWAYEKTEEFNILLQKWIDNNPKCQQ